MAHKTLTDLGIERVKPPTKEVDRVEIWDRLVLGMGIRIRASGTRTFFLMYRIGGKQRRMTVGRFTNEFGVEKAREAARAALKLVEVGKDPAEAEKAAAVAADDDRLSARSPLSKVLAAWIARQVKPNRSDWNEVERALNLDLGAKFGDRSISTIAQEDILEMLDAIIDRGAPVHANRVLTMTKTFFRWCLERKYVSQSPATLVRKQTKEVERERVLELPELARIWNAAETLGYPFGPIVRLLILTGQRRDEVAGMRWGEIDTDGATWTLPPPPPKARKDSEKLPARAKNRKEHKVALAPAALAIIEKVPRQGSPLLFTTTGKTVVSGWSRSKDRLDRLLMSPGAEVGPPTPIAPWTLHDLRRAAATGMAGLNIPPHIVDKILNHTQGTIKGVAAIYNRHPYLDERRAALVLWAETVARGVTAADSGRSPITSALD
jgi:integrase